MPWDLNIKRPIVIGLVFTFLVSLIQPSYAQEWTLPVPGVMVHLSPQFNPPILKGIKVYPDNPFRFDFILDIGNGPKPSSKGQVLNLAIRQESIKLIKYFLTSITIPEKDLWVNLSPYEKNRIIPQNFGLTEMGCDLLAEDYMLKQITASLIYPEEKIGKRFWKRIYEEAAKRYKTTSIPVNTFNKVWIVPEKAVVYENVKAGAAYIVESRLKVMLEQDYLSLKQHEGIRSESTGAINGVSTNQLGSQIVREIVIPELTKEVNEGRNFSLLRQVYDSLILAMWYKKKVKDSILEQVYVNKNKVAGVNIDDPQEKQKIYQRYLKAFKKGVFNYIKKDLDPIAPKMVLRKYFSGGAVFSGPPMDKAMRVTLNPKGVYKDSGRSPQLSMVSTVFLVVGNGAKKSQDRAMRVAEETYTPHQVDLIVRFNPNFSGRFFTDHGKGESFLDDEPIRDTKNFMFKTLRFSLDQLVKDIENNPKYQRVVAYSLSNFMHNDWFIIYDGKTHQVYHRQGEPILKRTYSMFIIWEDGEVSSEDVRFVNEAENGKVKIILPKGQQKNGLGIKSAFFGQRIIQQGTKTSWKKLYNQFDDLFHLFLLPQFVTVSHGRYIWGEIIGGKELYVGLPNDEKSIDRKLLKQVLLDDGKLELNLSPYLPYHSLEEIKRDALESRGYKEKPYNDSGELKVGEYRIQGQHLQIRLIKAKYPHDLIGITRKKQLVLMNFTGNKLKRIGYAIADLQDEIIAMNKRRIEDPIEDVFLLANSADVIKRENGKMIMDDSAENPREYHTAVLVIATKKEASRAMIAPRGVRKFDEALIFFSDNNAKADTGASI